jgi:hypothetical protein
VIGLVAAGGRGVITKGAMKGPHARERRRPRAALAAALAVLVGTSGCSFYWVRRAPPPAQWPDPVLPSSSEERCTDSVFPAVADTTIGAAAGTLAFIERNAVADVRQPLVESPAGAGHFAPMPGPRIGDPSYFGRGVAAVFGVWSLVAIASAVYGYVNVSRCNHYKSRFH